MSGPSPNQQDCGPPYQQDRFPTQFPSHWPHLAARLAVSSDPRRRPRTARLRNPSPRVLGVGWRPGPLDFSNQTSLSRPDVQRPGRARVNPAGVGTLERSAEGGREGAGGVWRRGEPTGGRASEEAAGTSRQPVPHTPRAARGHRRPPAPNFKSGAGARRWASRQVAACQDAAPFPGDRHLHPASAESQPQLPLAGDEARRRWPHGGPGVRAGGQAAGSAAALGLSR